MSEVVAIVDYHAGNLTSVQLALEKVGWAAAVTSDPEEVRAASRVVFPGVGAAGAAMMMLRSLGLDEALRDYVRSGRPLLGICLGAQIILGYSEENHVECLGLVPGRVERLMVPESAKVPHMGWNEVEQRLPHPLWEGVPDGAHFYFVHSFAPSPMDAQAIIGTTDYYGPFASALADENVVACQFHPERSGRVGLRLLVNFLHWNP